jgi:GTP-binding protein
MSGDNFVDYVKIHCRSGKGGAGSAHFLRTRKNPRGGPDGGDGGRGGHVIVRGNAQLWTLLHLRYTKHIRAGDGEGGSGQLCTGASGEDTYLEVPLGTVARDPDSGEVFFEVVKDGEEHILMPGGRGGQGNDHFKSPTNRAPRYAQPGEEGQEGWRILELKLLADVGLVGFPNAGKSTLLAAITAATPRIADYPFTTLRPNLGLVPYRDGRSFVMADIPGIIEGAHEGRGLGLRFLRHIERNSLLLFMIPVDAEDIAKEYKVLLNELKQYNPELIDKPRMLAVTKADMMDTGMLEELRPSLPKGVPSLFISSVSGLNIERLKDRIWALLNEQQDV